MANKFKNTKGLDSTIIPLTSFNESKVLSDKNYKVLEDNKNSEKEKQIETNIINLVKADFIKDYKKEVEFIKNNNNKSKDNSDISQPIENIRILLDNYKGIVNLLSVVFNKDMEIKRFSRSSN